MAVFPSSGDENTWGPILQTYIDSGDQGALSRTARTQSIPALGVFFAEANGADSTGTVSAVAAINQTLADNGSVYLVGTYLIDGPILAQQIGQKITLAPGSTLLVAAGYAGDVIRVGGSASIRGVVIEGGGTIVEVGKSGGAATAPSAWTAVRFQAVTGVGVTACRVEGIQIQWPGTAVAWEAQGTGWVNGCVVQRLRVMYPNVLFNTVTPGSGVGYSANTVKDVMAQCGNSSTYGVKNLCGTNWTFEDVMPWDPQNNAAYISAQITASATNVRIIGGALTVQNFSNLAAADQVTVIDPYQMRPWLLPQVFQPPMMTPRPIQTGVNATPTSVSTGDWPAWSFPDANAGVTFLWRLPVGCTQAEISLIVMDLSGAAGDVWWLANFQASPGSATAAISGATTNPAAGTSATIALPIRSVLVGGTVYRVSISRNGSNASDTLAGAIGLVGVSIRSIR